MFKLPQLQPSLTGTNGLDSKSRGQSFLTPFLSTSRAVRDVDAITAASALEVKSWQAQGREMTCDGINLERYKSLAVHAEVKLAEALERCDRVSPVSWSAAGEEKPNKLRTAVCCQLLGEFSELCGPFSPVLRTIRDELVKSVYSSFYESESGALSFDQLPWFSAAERLEKEKQQLLLERESFKAVLAEQQDTVMRIEEQLAAFQRTTEAAQLDAAALRTRLQTMQSSEEASRLEAKTGREELKRLRKEQMRMRDELEAEKVTHKAMKESLEEAAATLRSEVTFLQEALQQADFDVADAQRQADERLPASALDTLRAELVEANRQLDAAVCRAVEVESAKAAMEKDLGTSTPRPDWSELAPYGVQVEDTTQNTVLQASEVLAAYSERLTKHTTALQLHKAMLLPDPPPAPIQLIVITDASEYFLTEGSSEAAAGATVAVAEPLGLSARIPRCLRATERVELQPLDVHATEALVCSIWQAKCMHEQSGMGTQSLQSFLFQHLHTGSTSASQQTQQPTPGERSQAPNSHASAQTPSAAAQRGRGGSIPPYQPGGSINLGTDTKERSYASHHSIKNAHQGATAPKTVEQVQEAAYSLYHACATHSAASARVRTFAGVLSGQLPESVLHQQQTMLTSVLTALESLPRIQVETELGQVLESSGRNSAAPADALADDADKLRQTSRSPSPSLSMAASGPLSKPGSEQLSKPGSQHLSKTGSEQLSKPGSEQLSKQDSEQLSKPGSNNVQHTELSILHDPPIIGVSVEAALETLDSLFAHRAAYKLSRLRDACRKDFPGQLLPLSLLQHILAPSMSMTDAADRQCLPTRAAGTAGHMDEMPGQTMLNVLLQLHLEEAEAEVDRLLEAEGAATASDGGPGT